MSPRAGRSVQVGVACFAVAAACGSVLSVAQPASADRDLTDVSPGSAAATGLSVQRPVPHRLLVKTTRAAGPESLPILSGSAQALGGRWYSVRVVDATGADRDAQSLAAMSGVAKVAPDWRRQLLGDRFYRRLQPYLRASMDINDAWRRSSGRGVTVAVVDSGVDAGHPDLTRVRKGRDFVDGDRHPQDANGHGTFVAGVIGAERDNRRGIAGVARADILPIRALTRRGVGRDSDIARGIRWAVQHGADVVNLSLGGPRRSPILRDALRFANRNGSVVVASTGNTGGTRPMYPAAYPEAIAVGASDLSDRMTVFSQHGWWLDVIAPGHEIVSTWPGNRYAIGDGTSFSAPLVSGAAALLAAQHPRWTSSHLRAALRGAAADAGPIGPDPFTGFGVLDVDGLLGGTQRDAVPLTRPVNGTTPTSARPLQRDSVIRGAPEGTSTWFRLSVSSPKRIEVGANLRRAQRGVIRGDTVLTLYGSNFRRLDQSDVERGAGNESVSAIVDDDVYVEVENRYDTRWPAAVLMALKTQPRSPGAVEAARGPQPALLGSDPLPESAGHPPGDPVTVDLSAAVAPRSISRNSVAVIDGISGRRLERQVTVDGGGNVVINPLANLPSGRDFAVVLSGLRSAKGRTIPEVRIGFRTAG